MQRFGSGIYLGINRHQCAFNGIIVSETVYSKGLSQDWHYHVNPYLTFVVHGGSREKRKKDSGECISGQAFFYNRFESHCNFDYQPDSRNFNVEFEHHFFLENCIDPEIKNCAFKVTKVQQKFALLKIYKEFKIDDSSSALSIQALSLKILSDFEQDNKSTATPSWVKCLRALLEDDWAKNYSLNELSVTLGVHPVTISKYFPKYFHCTLGEYVRRMRIDKSLSMIKNKKLSLTTIAYACGFADQSHFIRTFRRQTGLLPHQYRTM